MTSGKLKLLSAALSVAALVATPALASTAHHKAKAKGYDAYASQPQPQLQQPHELYGWEGQLLGTDPDPNIRFQLQRDKSGGTDQATLVAKSERPPQSAAASSSRALSSRVAAKSVANNKKTTKTA
jgi:hypothetical protein